MASDPRCGYCGVSVADLKSNAKYCSRSHKSQAADRKSRASGRGREVDQARYARERDRRKAYARQQYWSNPEASREYSRQWRASNPEKRHAQSARRRAAKLGSGSALVTDRDVSRLFDRQSGCCAYCGEPAELTIDHVVPLSRGGTHSVGNLVGACRSCNCSKNASLLIEWRNCR